jgi:hypothetical protein
MGMMRGKLRMIWMRSSVVKNKYDTSRELHLHAEPEGE